MKNKSSLYHLFFVFITLTLWSTLSFAHLDLISTSPSKDEVVLKPIQTITLKLTGKAEPRFSKIEVTEVATKERIDSGEAVVDQQNTLSVSLKVPLKAGKYHINWKAISVDTHKAHGEYDFTYAPKE